PEPDDVHRKRHPREQPDDDEERRPEPAVEQVSGATEAGRSGDEVGDHVRSQVGLAGVPRRVLGFGHGWTPSVGSGHHRTSGGTESSPLVTASPKTSCRDPAYPATTPTWKARPAAMKPRPSDIMSTQLMWESR